MKLTVSKENFKKAINLNSHFVSPKVKLPILGNILIKAEKTHLSLSSTNLESSVSTKIAAKIDEEGEITLPGKILSELIPNLTGDQINLETEKEHLKVICGNFKSKILGMNSSDFPSVPNSVKKDSLGIDSHIFKQTVLKTYSAASSDETRPVLTGVLVFSEEDSLVFVSTDGFRLTKKIIKNKGSEMEKVIIPKSILLEIAKYEIEGEIKIEVDKENSQILFEINDTVFSSKLIDGQFPDYEKIIPKGFVQKVEVDKEDFEKAIKLSSIFARDSGNVIKLQLAEDKLQIISESSASGNQETEIEIKTEGDVKEFGISFNFKFIEDLIKVIEGDTLLMELNGQDKATKFLDPKDSDFLHLIMPIRSN